MTPIVAIGLELWSMTSDILFDNFIICAERKVSDQWAADGWALKKMVATANEVPRRSSITWLIHSLLVSGHKINICFLCFV